MTKTNTLPTYAQSVPVYVYVAIQDWGTKWGEHQEISGIRSSIEKAKALCAKEALENYEVPSLDWTPIGEDIQVAHRGGCRWEVRRYVLDEKDGE